MNKRVWVSAVLFLGIAAAIWISHRANNPTTNGGTLSPVAASSPRPSSAPPLAPLSVPDKASSPSEREATPDERGVGDNLARADAILAKAQGGDADAQYALYRLLFECDDGYHYFDVGNKRRSLDEALQIASTRGPAMNIDDVNEIYQKCHRLKESDSSRFGKAEDWLRKSADARNPVAQIDLASMLTGEAGVSGTVDNAAKRDEAKKLVRDALASKDPAVIFGVGDLTSLFSGDFEKAANHDQWIWKIAACQRGYDCSSTAEWRKAYCRFDLNCQPYDTGLDVIRRFTKSDYEQIQQEAKDLNARLDANDFSDLGG